MSDTNAATNGLPTGAGRLHPHWVNFGLDEAAGRIWVMAPADGGRAVDALLGQGTALGHGRMVARMPAGGHRFKRHMLVGPIPVDAVDGTG